MSVEAVVFDWGGTLSKFVEAELVDAWRLAARHLSPDHEEELAAEMEAVEANFWATTASHQRSATLSQLLALASSKIGLDVAEALMEEAAMRHLDAWTPHVRHYLDAVPTLTMLRQRGIKIGLLSNTHWPRTFLERFLERDGLLPLIDVRLYTSELPYQKPHPSAFLAVLGALNVDDPANVVFVGDRRYDDIAGAKGVGMRAVLRPNRYVADSGPPPDAEITELRELIGLVDRWQHQDAQAKVDSA